MRRDLVNNVEAVTALINATRTATGTGAAVDIRGFDSAKLVLSVGTVATGGTFTGAIGESDDGTTFTAVAAGDLQGSFTAIAAASAGMQEVGYIGSKQYITGIVTFGGTGAGAAVAAVVERANPSRKPI